MKRSSFYLLVAAVVACLASTQKTFGIVGYYMSSIQPGNNLIANELGAFPDNNLNTVLTNGILAGSTFTELDPVTKQTLPVSTYDGTTWNLNYAFEPDETGGILNSPAATTAIIVGQVLYLDNNLRSTFVPPNRAAGTYLLGYAVPLTTTSFQDIIGRDPRMGEWVQTLNAATQQASTTTFLGAGWDNGTPSIPLGAAAYFSLVEVPEPSTYALAILGTAMFLVWRIRGRHV